MHRCVFNPLDFQLEPLRLIVVSKFIVNYGLNLIKMKQLLLATLLLLPLLFSAQCPDCTPDESCVSEEPFPTICPLILPDATAGAYYETVMTFYLPGTIVDPDSELEATLLEVVITSVVGVPFGLEYEANSENNTYYPSEGDNYGCATICGTPLVAGSYEINISVTVLVSALGFEQTVNESFSLPLTVLAGEGGNVSFTYDNLFGCGEVAANYEALIDGSPSVTSYDWDFGNGNIGNVATPPTQLYTEEGEYTVTLETTIEDYVLQSVNISSLASGWGGDVEEISEALFNPDPYFVIIDGDGSTVYTSDAIIDSETGSWNSIGLALTNPPYSIEVYDQDNGGLFGSSDDFLGSDDMELIDGSFSFSSGETNGTITENLEVTTVLNNEETVTVFPIPNSTFTYLDEEGVLDYDDPQLASFLWTLNADTIQQGPQDSLVLDGPGLYLCTVTNIYGCEATSDEFVLCPEITLLYNPVNETLTTEGGFDSYTWYFNGLELEGETGATISATELGNYSVTITTEYGCEVGSEVFVLAVSVDEVAKNDFLMWPNPAKTVVHMNLPEGSWELTIFDSSGRIVKRVIRSGGNQTVSTQNLAPGIYAVHADNQHNRLSGVVVVSR